MKSTFVFIVSFFILFIGQTLAQNEVKFGPGMLRQCNGNLKSSEQGQTTGHYAHDENTIMTICVPGAASMQWAFHAFCTEKDYDLLKIYRGKDTLGTLIGVYSGIQGPGSFSLSDSCITFHFISDASVSCFGWDAMWFSQIVNYPAPLVQLESTVSCGLTSLDVVFDHLFPCYAIQATQVSVSGPISPNVVSVVPLNCNADTFSSRFRVSFSSPLDRGGIYLLEFVMQEKDLCDSMWTWRIPLSFSITDCPIQVDLSVADSIVCKGSCVWIRDTVTGGNLNYTYNWQSAVFSGAGPHLFCPSQDTMLVLEVTDGVSIPGRDTLFLKVIDPPIAGSDTVVCQSAAPFYLSAFPAGGTWKGGGAVGSDGLFSPGISGQGIFKVWYELGLCADTLIVDVRPIFAGAAQASCPFAAPFMMTGFAPAGGFWTGDSIDSSGRFSPSTSGQFKVTYQWGACKADKWVYVDSIQIPQTDTTCLTSDPFLLTFSPPGGRWSGPGITQTVLGRFSPSVASFGNKNLVYTLNGCRDTLEMHVKRIQTSPPVIVCPEGGVRTLPDAFPPGGFWTGNGILYADSALYSPAHLFSPSWDSVVYHADACQAKQFIQAITTQVITDSIVICGASGKFNLQSPVVSVMPSGGSWQGIGVLGNQFDPQLTGPGDFYVYYHANNCVDSLKIKVLPLFEIQSDTSVCGGNYTFNLYASESGGRWQGPGIVSPFTGGFNPSLAGVGRHLLQFISAKACRDTLFVDVEALPSILLNKAPSVVCVKDTLWELKAIPDTGVFSGQGVQGTYFSSLGLNKGKTSVQYTVGKGVCAVKDSFEVEVLAPLELHITASKDSICKFSNIELQAFPKGGKGVGYQYVWSTGAEGTDAIYVFPEISGYYSVVLKDACSDDITDSVFIAVAELPAFSLSVNPPLCQGSEGFAKVTPQPSIVYKWFVGGQVEFGDSIFAPVGNTYRLEMTDTVFSCSRDTSFLLPSHPRVTADFSIQGADRSCLRLSSPFLPLLDLSTGGESGYWQLQPGGQLFPYSPNQIPSIALDALQKSYSLLLQIESAEGCLDSQIQDFCIVDTVFAHVPTAFSPNKDGLNDLFEVHISSVKKFQFEIYNRWGEKVFESDSPTIRWDGTFKGVDAPSGYYAYRLFYQSFGTYFKTENGMFYLLR